MTWIVTDELIDRARMNPAESGLCREERASIFNDRMLEEQAANKRYSNGRSIKEHVDGMLQAHRTPSFSRGDTLGRAYAKMAARRNA